MGIKYKYNDDKILEELKEYVDNTYSEHYGGNDEEVQTFELMMKRPERAMNFAVMSALKYSDRFGSKDGYNRKDLLKIAHFVILAIHALDKKNEVKN